ncbi:helix-turn-helix transcriptional regulator [Brevibacillus choshinensis]|uniref:YafY family transcriptional regulator n=1 Tax=Brevibacillus choshinensis TaxID=54911 RepID=A0ABX7FR59_BRECH|nr:YafY family protein [Brevibacillus choshinensis]QRG68657.1 YafY family transcriptional regulator [Brevibacillus choshinensis]
MNKTDRLLAIVLELQRKGVVRAEDLAARFETSVRTIYRDMQALSEASVPIVGEPGIGYSLMEGYFLPPVSFTVEEAVSLLMGAHFVEQKFDPRYQERARSSRGKIEAVLPEQVRREAANILSTMRLLSFDSNSPGTKKEKERVDTVRQALLDAKKLSFHYRKSMADEDGTRDSVRVVAPYGLTLVGGSWMMIGHCDLRGDLRHFRLSRMSKLAITEEGYQRPPDFHLHAYKPVDDRNMHVRLLARSEIAEQIKESRYFYLEACEDRPDGLLVTLRVRQTEEVMHWVLGWGAHIEVLEPESFRNEIREEIEKMRKRY